ncbi:MAG: PQQ-dependent sugar dehydrogenase [Ferruginibacter sp.]
MKNRKTLKYILILLPVLFVVYLALNNWHIVPQPFITYSSLAKDEAPDSSTQAKQYRQYCGGCHGMQMDKFVEHHWKFGKTKSAIFKAIKYGYTNDGMPGYEASFSDKEIYELTDYLLTGIAQQKPKPAVNNNGNVYNTELLKIKTEVVASGMDIPWCMAFLPDGNMLVTDRNGKLYRIAAGKLQEINGVPEVVVKGQGGLLDVLLHPDFKNNQLLYLSYSKRNDKDEDQYTTAILRAKLDGDRLTNQQDIFVAQPYSSTSHHYGGRMVFSKDGYLYFSVGERGNEKQNPQTLQNDLGKIHRIKDDGSIPADNPFVADKKAKPSIFCYGNRNPQGLAIHPKTGELWENEHGPMGGDEINLIQRGKNYGWPVITYGINYNGTPITDITAKKGMEQPLHFWVPSIAPGALAFVQGDKYKGWEGDVLSGSLKFHWLSRCKTDGHVITSEESMLKDVGRIRDLKMAPDGYIYVTVESPGQVIKLVPVE